MQRTRCLVDSILDQYEEALPWTDDQEYLARLCAKYLSEIYYTSNWFVGRHDIHIDVDFITYIWAGRKIVFRYQEINNYASIDGESVEWIESLLDELREISHVDNYDPFKAFAIIRGHPKISYHPEFIPVALCLFVLEFMDGDFKEIIGRCENVEDRGRKSDATCSVNIGIDS